MTEDMYKKIWDRLFPNKWIPGLFLILIFGISRFIIVLQANVTGQFQWTSCILSYIPIFIPNNKLLR
jgi:hypothetical protein